MDEEELKDKYDKEHFLKYKSTYLLIMELIEKILRAPVIVEIIQVHLIYLEKQSMITIMECKTDLQN